jgi:hypothetical protein
MMTIEHDYNILYGCIFRFTNATAMLQLLETQLREVGGMYQINSHNLSMICTQQRQYYHSHHRLLCHNSSHDLSLLCTQLCQYRNYSNYNISSSQPIVVTSD